jgi:hypothetical protein
MWTITYEAANLVSRHQGTLPVILSCPHDGEVFAWLRPLTQPLVRSDACT